MAISEAFAVTETVGTTEHSFVTDTSGPDAETSDGFFQPWFDLNALAAGDVFQIAGYEKVQSAGTQRKFMLAYVSGVQGVPIWVGPCVGLMHGWDFTIDKISGTDRSIEGSIRKAP